MKKGDILVIDSIILAGGKIEKELTPYTDAKSKAFIKIGKKYMVEYVIDVLKSMEEINRVILVASPKDAPPEIGKKVDKIVNSGDRMIDSLLSGLQNVNTSLALVLPSDLPLISYEAIHDFLKQCANVKADLYYGYLSKDDSEKMFPNVHHTYAHLKKGYFCGTGLFLIRPEIAYRFKGLIDQALNNRKNILALVKLLGLSFIVKYALGILSVADAEKKVGELLGCVAKGIRTRYPEAGFNVDAPNELLIAKKILEESPSNFTSRA